MKLGEPVRVYLNHPTPCPYLPGRDEQRILIPLAAEPELAQEQIGFFTPLGFRRSQNMLYRPQCPSCTACLSLRLPVAAFTPNDTQARTRQRNRGFGWQQVTLAAAARLYPLFYAYQQARHSSSDMAQFSEADFRSLLEPAASGNTCFTLTSSDQVVGAMLADRTADGYSAVYSFYDPAFASYSLGTELVLRLIDQAHREKLSYIYLGYWVRDCAKMNYKNKFRPAEILTAAGWQAL